MNTTQMNQKHTQNASHTSGQGFVEGTLILSDNGLVDITDIQAGDKVLTHKGRWREVQRVVQTESPIYRISGEGHPGLLTASGQLFHSCEMDAELDFPEPTWIPASNVGYRHWASPYRFHEATSCRLEGVPTETLYWLAGVLLKRGTWTETGDLSIHLAVEEEEELLYHIRQAHVPYAFYTDRSIHILAGIFRTWFQQHFMKTNVKHLPSWVYGMEKANRKALLHGFLFKRRGTNEVADVWCGENKALMFGMKLLGQSVDYAMGISQTESGGPLPVWVLTLHTNLLNEVDDQQFFSLVIQNIDTKEMQWVYSLQVDGDNSYVADGFVVHGVTATNTPSFTQQ